MYKPLPSFIDIKESPIQGKGLFATKNIKANTNIGISHVMLDNPKIWIRTPVGGFVNHSDKPNCMIVIDQAFTHLYFLFTTEQIMPGEELTVKYNTYNPEEE
jgi:SET domain-containing protein